MNINLYILPLILINLVGIKMHTTIVKDVTEDQIIGDWISPQNDLIVRCYKSNEQYHAKVIWFKEYFDNTADDPNGVPEKQWLGARVMSNFKYKEKEWVDGEIWNLKNGKKYSAYIKMPSPNKIQVVGYVFIRFFSESTEFTRYTGKPKAKYLRN